jgi:hypothetical protein
MARQVESVQSIVRAGLEPTYAAGDAVNHHEFTNDGETFIIVINAGGGSINVTIDAIKLVDGEAVSDRVVAVPAGETRFIGPFPTDIYNQPTGEVHFDLSGATSVTVAAVQLKN